MQNQKHFSKIFLYISFLSGILWMGTYFLRLILSYQLFEVNEFTVKQIFNEQNLIGFFIIFNSAIKTSGLIYLIFIVSYLVFILTTKAKLKQNGWLFIITIIICLTVPFEIYLLTIDYRIIKLIDSSSFSSSQVISLIVERFKVLSSFSLIELFAYFSIIYLAIFQPLKMHQANEN